MIRSAVLVAVAALAACPVAAADGDEGGSTHYVSRVTALSPRVPGLEAQVLGGDDRLQVTNATGKNLFVPGYEGEPYLEFRADGVFENRKSPTLYLNRDRYAREALPKDASPKADPVWVRVTRSRTYDWHDHRTHWMSTIDPLPVRKDPGARHHVFAWKIPLRVGTERATIVGTLDYVPSSGGLPGWSIAVIAAGGAVLIGGVALVGIRHRRGRRPTPAIRGPAVTSGSNTAADESD